jgi:hypothetical protein
VARQLGLKVARRAKTVTLARAASAFRSAGRAKISPTLSAAALRALGRAHRNVKLTISATSSATGAASRMTTRTLLLRR